jgi:hypothetical protein
VFSNAEKICLSTGTHYSLYPIIKLIFLLYNNNLLSLNDFLIIYVYLRNWTITLYFSFLTNRKAWICDANRGM